MPIPLYRADDPAKPPGWASVSFPPGYSGPGSGTTSPLSTATMRNPGQINNLDQLTDLVHQGNHVPLWVHQNLASDLVHHYGQSGDVVPHPGVHLRPPNMGNGGGNGVQPPIPTDGPHPGQFILPGDKPGTGLGNDVHPLPPTMLPPQDNGDGGANGTGIPNPVPLPPIYKQPSIPPQAGPGGL